MYNEWLRVKGTDLTIGELKEANKKERLYDEEFIDDFFEEHNDDELVLKALGGCWAEEKDGYTILLEDVAE